MLISLKALIDNMEEGNELLNQFLSSFSCSNDEDIETFLHIRAINFEKLSKARTYLIVDEDELINNDLENVTIYGYVSVALKTLTIPDEYSNRKRLELDGFSAKFHGDPIREIPCYLIGQLARNSSVTKETVSGMQLIDFALQVIAKSVESVGGRYVMIECHDNEKLISFYKANMFTEISRIPDKENMMVQMIRKIC